MNDPLDPIFAAFGIEGASVLVVLVLISLICNIVGRLIPDDAVGILGIIRKITKVVGLYVSNRLTTGVTVNAVAREVAKIPEKASDKAEEVADRVTERIEDEINELGERIVKPFPGLGGPGFPVFAMMFLVPLGLMLSGCATPAASGATAAYTAAYRALQVICPIVNESLVTTPATPQ